VKGKKYFLIKVLSYLHSLGRTTPPVVVLEALNLSHLEHYKVILEILSNRNDITVFVITPGLGNKQSHKNISYFNSISELPLYRQVKLLITTGILAIPHWLHCPVIYFGHGMGPKLNYVADPKIGAYDYCFAPCKPTFDVQRRFLSESQVIPLGMPILDDLSTPKKEIYQHFNLDDDKPLLIYAPSWCNNMSKVSNIKLITSFLQSKEQFNIIISPHPLLFNPERCDGKVFFPLLEDKHNLNINTPESKFTTLELVKASALVISDISSILFEAMALNKIVFFDGNQALYEYCEASEIYAQVMEVCPVPVWDSADDQTIEKTLKNDEKAESRTQFINQYLFNNGKASNMFIEQINKLLKL
jgi:hypothetical protein